jgi:hypothetical protein
MIALTENSFGSSSFAKIESAAPISSANAAWANSQAGGGPVETSIRRRNLPGGASIESFGTDKSNCATAAIRLIVVADGYCSPK